MAKKDEDLMEIEVEEDEVGTSRAEVSQAESEPREEEVEFDDEASPGQASDPDDDLPEEYRGLTRKQILEKVSGRPAQAQPSPGVSAADIKDLIQAVRPAPSPETPKPLPSLRLTPEEKKRLKEEWYSTEEPGEILDTLLAAKMESYTGALTGVVAAKFAEQEAEILKVSDPEYMEFKADVDEILASWDPVTRNSPGAHKRALQEARLRNIDKIVEKRIQAKLEEAAGQAGSSPGKTRVIPPKQASAGSGTGPGQVSSKPKVYVDRKTWEREIEKASAMGVGPGSGMWEATKAGLLEKYGKPIQRRVEIR